MMFSMQRYKTYNNILTFL